MMNRLLDLRFVIGLFFVAVGVLLFGYSLTVSKTDEPIETINRWSGIVFTAFGLFMIFLSFLSNAKEE